ncbi:MAG: glycine cleavage system protein GcvH [Syntrophomonadaceae bacterium]|nr:glycine cleavage system protein GcvH [Syntrophomonadaceae bacterium]
MNIPADLLYTKDHEWIRVEGDQCHIGISDFAQSHLGDIVFVELPELDIEVGAGQAIGVIESVKAVATLFCPVGGTIVEINEELESSPELLNEDCYANWIAVVELNDKSELETLMEASAYSEFCRQAETGV